MRRISIFLLLLVTACAGPTVTPVSLTTYTAPSAETVAVPTDTAAASTPTVTLHPTATAPALPSLCTPLQGYPFDALSGLTANPYNPPPPGSDDPHHGVDLAVRMPGTDIAITGHPVQSAMAGRVAAVIQDRFPYGNAILVETALEDAPTEWWQVLPLPTPAPTMDPTSALTCPEGPTYVPADSNRRSLYILYAHLAAPPTLTVETDVACGQAIGAVGDSGNALAPHLHFETRVGPSGLRLNSMAHYDASANTEEMRNYCLWRVSGLFQLVDPNQVLALEPKP